MELQAFKILQNNMEFYTSSIRLEELINITTVSHRTIVGFDEDNHPIYNNNIQRPVNNKRAELIRDYIINDPDACFPSSIVVNIPEILLTDDPQALDNRNIYQLTVDSSKVTFNHDRPLYVQIIDGQHRFSGLKKAIEFARESDNLDLANKLKNFIVPVSVFIGADIGIQAMLFSIINRTPVKVTSDLVYDLFGVTSKDSPQKIALTVALSLNAIENVESGDKTFRNPFYRSVRLLGQKSRNQHTPINQGRLIREITLLVCPDMKTSEYERLQNREYFLRIPGSINTIFRQMYGESKDDLIFRIILNFYTAASLTIKSKNNTKYFYPSETKDNPFQRTIGFIALLEVLKRLFKIGLEQKDFSVEFFLSSLSPLKNLDVLDEVGKSIYSYNTAGQTELTKALLQQLGLRV